MPITKENYDRKVFKEILNNNKDLIDRMIAEKDLYKYLYELAEIKSRSENIPNISLYLLILDNYFGSYLNEKHINKNPAKFKDKEFLDWIQDDMMHRTSFLSSNTLNQKIETLENELTNESLHSDSSVETLPSSIPTPRSSPSPTPPARRWTWLRRVLGRPLLGDSFGGPMGAQGIKRKSRKRKRKQSRRKGKSRKGKSRRKGKQSRRKRKNL